MPSSRFAVLAVCAVLVRTVAATGWEEERDRQAWVFDAALLAYAAWASFFPSAAGHKRTQTHEWWAFRIVLLAFSATVLYSMEMGIRQYRHSIDSGRLANGRSFESLDSRERCYDVISEPSDVEDPILGVYLRVIGDVEDPWFDNPWMLTFTTLCFSSLFFAAVESTRALYSLHTLGQLSAQQAMTAMWVWSVLTVAYAFAPLPICTFLTLVGFLHNVVEGVLVVSTAWHQHKSPKTWRFGAAVGALVVWLLLEFLGGVIFGRISFQWLVFGVMGACADVALIIATVRFYRRKPDSERACFLSAVLSHFIYVIFFFINCTILPPQPKISGLFLNCVAVWMATRYLQLGVDRAAKQQ